MSKEVVLEILPTCSFCLEVARYDFKTDEGLWAFGCEPHWKEHRAYMTLGTGKGQYLALAREQR